MTVEIRQRITLCLNTMPAFYANMYREDGLTGGHIILLNKADSEYYEADLAQAKEALTAFPRGCRLAVV